MFESWFKKILKLWLHITLKLSLEARFAHIPAFMSPGDNLSRACLRLRFALIPRGGLRIYRVRTSSFSGFGPGDDDSVCAKAMTSAYIYVEESECAAVWIASAKYSWVEFRAEILLIFVPFRSVCV